MRHKILVAKRIHVVICGVMTPCTLVHGYQYSGVKYCRHSYGRSHYCW